MTIKTQLATLTIIVATSFTAMADSELDVQDAKIVTVVTKSVAGYLNIANGRNCLMESAQGKPTLLPCNSVNKFRSEAAPPPPLHYIVLQSGRCLSDNGTAPLEGVTCNYQDTRQQWKILPNTQTNIRNVASKKCLTADGLNNQVKMALCSGVPAQSWKQP
ncbi:RICIN domain-containing protein [Serratia marcescens]